MFQTNTHYKTKNDLVISFKKKKEKKKYYYRAMKIVKLSK